MQGAPQYLAATDTIGYGLGYLAIPAAGVILVVLGAIFLARDARAK